MSLTKLLFKNINININITNIRSRSIGVIFIWTYCLFLIFSTKPRRKFFVKMKNSNSKSVVNIQNLHVTMTKILPQKSTDTKL